MASDCLSPEKGNQNSKRPLARPGKEGLSAAKAELSTAKEELRGAKKGLRTAKEGLPAAEVELRAAEARLRAAIEGLRAARLPAAKAELLAGKGCLEGGGSAAATGGPFPSHNIDFLSQLTLSAMGAGGGVRGNDIWGWTDSLDNREYALVGRSDGTAFVDVTDPVNPVYLGFLASHTGNTAWRDIKVYADHAYIVSDNNGSHGMQVFDLTQLRSVVTPPVSFSETVHYAGFAEAHNIAINEATGYAYIVGAETFSGGLHFIDLTNPVNPVAAGGFSADGYTHDNQVVTYAGPDTAYIGQEIAFNSNEDTLTIVDVTNKTTPVQLSRTGYSLSAYTHQGWLTEDHAWFLSNDELDERNNGSINFTRTHIWNVADLDAPVYIGFYEATVASIDHNLYVHNGLVYMANYTTGLRVLEHADIANGNLTEVAFIDTHPSKDSLTSFDGAWSVYPFFASGTVLIGDRDEGLVVVRVLQADLAITGMDIPDPVVEGFPLDYQINITNNGPDPAANVTLTHLLPAGVSYVQATPSQGSCSATAGTVTCLLGALADGTGATVNVAVTAITPGGLNSTASVSADEVDSEVSDNAVTLVTTVLPDQDGDGLDDVFEVSIGTDPQLPDTDGDAVTDYDEVAFDGDAFAYTPGQDLNPLSTDTDNDLLDDGTDPLPLVFNFNDGDLAPVGAPDGQVNAADILVATRIVLGLLPAGDLELSHGDLYPQGAPDGNIDISDLILLQQLVLQ
ncbi:MAG: choice-of-anchor B family protein [Gammaproteobacteria bacterium]